ncbi:hypothetical protein THAOC_18405, partial [Thalassiosira oceanica]
MADLEGHPLSLSASDVYSLLRLPPAKPKRDRNFPRMLVRASPTKKGSGGVFRVMSAKPWRALGVSVARFAVFWIERGRKDIAPPILPAAATLFPVGSLSESVRAEEPVKKTERCPAGRAAGGCVTVCQTVRIGFRTSKTLLRSTSNPPSREIRGEDQNRRLKPPIESQITLKYLRFNSRRTMARRGQPQQSRAAHWRIGAGVWWGRQVAISSSVRAAIRGGSYRRFCMSCVAVNEGSEDACANCEEEGSEGGAVKLKNCTACRLVKYCCGVDCQRAHHRQQHKDACRQRVAELKDYRLIQDSTYAGMKRVCVGCNFAAQKRGMFDCPFCRTPYPDNDADAQQFFPGLQKDMQKAVQLMSEAAELGSIKALFNLGYASG